MTHVEPRCSNAMFEWVFYFYFFKSAMRTEGLFFPTNNASLKMVICLLFFSAEAKQIFYELFS